MTIQMMIALAITVVMIVLVMIEKFPLERRHYLPVCC